MVSDDQWIVSLNRTHRMIICFIVILVVQLIDKDNFSNSILDKSIAQYW